MTPRPTFSETVSKLVKAYLNDTLIHGDCGACAVGNIIAATIGAKIEKIDEEEGYRWIKDEQEITIAWQEVFCTIRGVQEIQEKRYIGQIKRQIDVTGYTWQELAKIESAFESKAYGLDRMYRGLMEVVDVLADIHGIDLKEKEEAKAMFQKC